MRRMWLGLALASALGTQLLAQQPVASAPQDAPDYKNPQIARAIAFFVIGGGHVYANEPQIGYPLLAGAAASVAIGYASVKARICFASRPDGTRYPVACQTEDRTAIRNGFIGAGVFWLISLWDAPRAVGRYNDGLTERMGGTPTSKLRLGHPLVSQGGNGSTLVGLTFDVGH